MIILNQPVDEDGIESNEIPSGEIGIISYSSNRNTIQNNVLRAKRHRKT